MTHILLAAGGTGGHVLPALALADELHARGVAVTFATDARGVKYIKDRDWMTTRVIRAGTLRKHPIRFFTDLFNLGIGIAQSFDLMRDARPDAVVGFGGYPCFPPLLAAQILNIPTMLHEQNAVIGKANAWLSRLCTKIALSLPDDTGLSPAQKKRVVVTGRPVSAAIDALAPHPYAPPAPNGPFNIVVMGGSQGAAILGQTLPAVLAQLPIPDRARLHIIQQARAEDVAAATTVYQNAGIKAQVAPFITDVAGALSTAHLFIGRSGGVVAEISVAGIPALYIPYPHHKDQQQLKNAQVIERAGGATVIIEDSGAAPALLDKITFFMHNPASLEKMAMAAKSCGRPRAAKALADAAIALTS